MIRVEDPSLGATKRMEDDTTMLETRARTRFPSTWQLCVGLSKVAGGSNARALVPAPQFLKQVSLISEVPFRKMKWFGILARFCLFSLGIYDSTRK